MENEPVWLTLSQITRIHDRQLDDFGGAHGIKDIGLVDSALNNPINLFRYEDVSDVLALGVRLAYAIGQNHGFVDGNKRTAAASMALFLHINGFALNVPDDEVDEPILGVWVKELITRQISEQTFYDRLVPFVSIDGDYDGDDDDDDDGQRRQVGRDEIVGNTFVDDGITIVRSWQVITRRDGSVDG